MVARCGSEGDPLMASSGVTDPGHREPLSQVRHTPQTPTLFITQSKIVKLCAVALDTYFASTCYLHLIPQNINAPVCFHEDFFLQNTLSFV